MDCAQHALPPGILRDGVSYNVRYIGSLVVATSMKQLDFPVRSALAKECIGRVCTAARMISANRFKKCDRRLGSFIAGQPSLRFGGQMVRLFISTASLSVVSLENDQLLFSHCMPDISFASGGDQTTADFVAYIAKTAEQGRYCYVFECGQGNEKEILSTIGQAFALRFEHATRSSVSVNAGAELGSAQANSTGEKHAAQLSTEVWYHGRISREESQRRVRHNGEFLVRQSLTDVGQFVLTGMQEGKHRHLLLIDKDGEVSTKDQKFNSISHLINYHLQHRLPITSVESSLLLRTLVARPVKF